MVARTRCSFANSRLSTGVRSLYAHETARETSLLIEMHHVGVPNDVSSADGGVRPSKVTPASSQASEVVFEPYERPVLRFVVKQEKVVAIGATLVGRKEWALKCVRICRHLARPVAGNEGRRKSRPRR